MYKHIPEDIHVKALSEALTLSNVEAIAEKYGISDQTIRRKYKLILSLTPSFIWLSPKNIPPVNDFLHQLRNPCCCPQCGSTKVSKNGKLRLVNWGKRVLKKIIPTFSNDKEDVQRFICTNCGSQIHSDEHNTLKQIRTSTKLFIDKFTCLLRFKEGLSLRSISRIIGFAFGINASLGYLSKFTTIIGKKAQDKMGKLSLCKATKKAVVAIIDETFPKIFHKSVSLGLVVCEHGLIRALGCVKRSSDSIEGLLKKSMGQSFCPSFLLGDFHPSYAEVARRFELTRLTDFVHAIRHLYKLVRIHIGKVRLSLKNSEELSPKQRKEMLKLKKKLLRKQVMPIIQTLFKGFKKQYRAVGHLYILGALEDLQKLTVQFPCLDSLYKAINKFVQKYLPTWALQMKLASYVPTTSNSVESKNSILKIFSRRIKAFYSKVSLERFFSAVALWENFDVKERGPYKGTSAIERAGIDLNDFGAANFFEAVELEKVSHHNSDTIESNKIIFYILKQVTQQAA